MKLIVIIFANLLWYAASAQSLQLHYDLRHTVNPQQNSKNIPTLYFEYYKTPDTGKYFIKFGSFLLKVQADFNGEQNNVGKYYMQLSQEVRFWKPKIFLDLQYSGGLGITTPRQYSYYIMNTYSVGLSYHYQIGGAFLSSVLFYKYVPYQKPSNDFLYTMYFYKGLWNYKADIEGDLSLWTENKNRGDAETEGLYGKQFFFFAEPQFWYNTTAALSLGMKANVYYHVNNNRNVPEVYPSAGLRYKFK